MSEPIKHLLKLAAQRHPFLNFTEQLFALFIQQLLV